ncbi:hypothetical protein CLPU_3c01410 [Gottschalkia purinilytica]|uniref:Uncharacterized protein n=2 Tax=Gottschalkia purinilytica TaxID=1503 RepID=A0A0L0WD18_GOTPU|nr:hypothetical protein CLPU_3c01410 [Gottschalkia purinilytica]
MERYERKQRQKSKNKLKVFFILALVIGLIFGLSLLDDILRNMTDTKEQQIYGIKLEDDSYTIQLFGKDYTIDQEIINSIINNIKSAGENVIDIVDKYKDKILNK